MENIVDDLLDDEIILGKDFVKYLEKNNTLSIYTSEDLKCAH